MLPKFTQLNKYFQSENVILTNVHERMTLTFKDLLRTYLDPRYVACTPLHDVKPSATENFIRLDNIYLGVEVGKQLELNEVKSQMELGKDFKYRCREFLITACVQIKKRYNFKDSVLEDLTIFAPKKALSAVERERTPSILPFAAKMPRISPADSETLQLQKLDDEWRQIILIDFPDEIKNEAEVDVFWTKVSFLQLI